MAPWQSPSSLTRRAVNYIVLMSRRLGRVSSRQKMVRSRGARPAIERRSLSSGALTYRAVSHNWCLLIESRR